MSDERGCGRAADARVTVDHQRLLGRPVVEEPDQPFDVRPSGYDGTGRRLDDVIHVHAQVALRLDLRRGLGLEQTLDDRYQIPWSDDGDVGGKVEEIGDVDLHFPDRIPPAGLLRGGSVLCFVMAKTGESGPAPRSGGRRIDGSERPVTSSDHGPGCGRRSFIGSRCGSSSLKATVFGSKFFASTRGRSLSGTGSGVSGLYIARLRATTRLS